MTQAYAEKNAKEWNTQDKGGGYIGYVTRFELPDDYLNQFEIKTVGDSFCQELWVPAAEMENFNQHIQGKIVVISSFKGEKYTENAELPDYMHKNDLGVSEW